MRKSGIWLLLMFMFQKEAFAFKTVLNGRERELSTERTVQFLFTYLLSTKPEHTFLLLP